MKKIIIVGVLVSSFLCSFAKEYKGAEIQSKQAFHFGKFETRFLSSSMSGMLSTFFLFENEGYLPCCKWQEIDVEVFGKGESNSWQSNPIYQTDGAGDRVTADEVHELPKGKFVDDYYTYTVEWTPDYIKWYVDGELIRSFTDTAALKIIGAKPMLAMFNHWSSEWLDWTGPFNGNQCPSYQIVDYIKVYDWVSDSTFEQKPSFEDDFKKDLSQWNISTHSFDGNICDFSKKNVAIRDGKLILAFTTEAAEGIKEGVKLGSNIDIEDGNWSDRIDYPYSVTTGISGMFVYEGQKVDFYNEKGEFVYRTLIEAGMGDMSTLKKGWYYLVISGTPKTLRKIEKK